MTRYRRTLLKAAVLDYGAIFRGIVFVTFRALLRVFKFTPDPPAGVDPVEYYTFNSAYAIGYLSILSIGSLGAGLTAITLRSSISLRYVTRFTKLTPEKARIENVIPGTIAFIIYTLTITLEIIVFTRIRSGIRIKPSPYFLPLLVFAALIAYAMALTFGYMAALTKRLRGFLTFFMLFLAFVSYFTLRVSYGRLSYLSPLQIVLYLLIYGFLKEKPVLGAFVMEMGRREYVDLRLVFLSGLIRLIILFLIGRIEMKKARGVRPELVITS